MNVQLPITGGHLLMGTDSVAELGHELKPGNNVYIVVHPDSREEADRLYAELGEGGTLHMPMADQFWGDYFGDLTDKYGTQWMISYTGEVARLRQGPAEPVSRSLSFLALGARAGEDLRPGHETPERHRWLRQPGCGLQWASACTIAIRCAMRCAGGL